MTNLEYLKFAIKVGYLNKLKWYYSVFTIQEGDTEYTKYNSERYTVKVDDTYIPITNVNTDRPLLSMTEPMVLKAGIDDDLVSNLKVGSTIDTTVGRCIYNKLISDIFGTKIPYINEQTSVKYLEKVIAESIHKSTGAVTDITIPEYKRYVTLLGFLQSLSRITTVSATPKSLTPPEGLEAFKKQLINDFDTKYGIEWRRDRTIILQYDKALKEFDNEWVKGEANDGFLVSGKVKNIARGKMYLGFGAEEGFDTTGNEVNLVTESLLDGYPVNDKEKLSVMYNSSRAGSYDRGHETQKGGAAAKDMLRATSSTSVTDGDCGSQEGKVILVTPEVINALTGRYILVNGSTKPIGDPKQYIGQRITVRSPLGCKTKGNKFCSRCIGDIMFNYGSISLAITGLSGVLLNISMQSMHGKVASSTKLNFIDDIV